MGEIIRFKIDNVELDERKLAIKEIKDVLIKEGATEDIAEKLILVMCKIIDNSVYMGMQQGVIEFLASINEQTDEEFEEFVQGLRLERQESRKGIE